jgi:hypothetical protein
MNDIMIISKVDTVEQTVQTIYYFSQDNYPKGYEVLKLLNTNVEDGVFYTSSFSKEYIDEEHNKF